MGKNAFLKATQKGLQANLPFGTQFLVRPLQQIMTLKSPRKQLVSTLRICHPIFSLCMGVLPASPHASLFATAGGGSKMLLQQQNVAAFEMLHLI
jgi:hypothetical protein